MIKMIGPPTKKLPIELSILSPLIITPPLKISFDMELKMPGKRIDIPKNTEYRLSFFPGETSFLVEFHFFI